MTQAAEKVSPGQRWSPPTARLHNAWTDAAYANQPSQRFTGDRNQGHPRDLRILVNSPNVVQAGGVVGWSATPIPTTYSKRQDPPVFPYAVGEPGRWGIAAAGIRAGSTAEVVISGAVYAYVVVTDIDHDHCDADAGGLLESGVCGPAKFLQPATSTGEQWLPVLLSRPHAPSFLASVDSDMAHATSAEVTLCYGGPLPTLNHGANEPVEVETETGVLIGMTSGAQLVLTTSTDLPEDTVVAWNFSGRTIRSGELVRIDRTAIKGGYPCFWLIDPWPLEEKWINGTADSVIEYGDLDKTITVGLGDEPSSEQHVVQYILHDGGDISSGKRVTARWWPTRDAYVIHLADCE